MPMDLKKKKELTFLVIGILMLLIVVTYTIISIRFLVTNLKEAFNAKSVEQPGSLRFNLEKAEMFKGQ